MTDINSSPLGKETIYTDQYSKDLLFPIKRLENRQQIGITAPLPFSGYDIWNGYEFSWLDQKTQSPRSKNIQITFPCESEFLVESKSLKLYLYSFANSVFEETKLLETLSTDLSNATNSSVSVSLIHKQDPLYCNVLPSFHGFSLDSLDVQIEQYQYDPEILTVDPVQTAQEVLTSDLLHSLCPVTGHPDWASIQIHYHGNKIDHQNLLKYFISLHDHPEFHEQCIERIFTDIKERCAPHSLTVQGSVTRRGGLDINPVRSTEIFTPQWFKLMRG